VTGEPKGITEGTEVRVTGLEAFAWSMGDRHGISFRAAAITPVPPVPAPAKSGGGA